MKFSIIIPLKELNNYIKESIPKILKLDYPKNQYEIIILPNNKPRSIPRYLQNERIKIVETDCVSPSIKRDIAVKIAMGEILAFIDDDSYPREDWLRVAEKTFNNISKEFVAVHGPAITPPNATKIEKMSGAFFESRLGGGATYRCKDVEKPFKIDDAPSVNLLVRRKIFLEVGGFGSKYWPGEDSIFCQKLKDNGYKLWHQNNMIVFHHRRKTIRKHLKQVSSYAEHRGNFFRKGIGCSRRVSYLIPYLFLIGNLSILFFIGWGLMPLLFLYFIIISFNLCLCKDLPFYLIPLTAVLTFASHLTYGFYFIKGFGMKEIRSKLR